MSDLISRQDAIDAIANVDMQVYEGDDAVGRRLYLTQEEMIALIEALPSAEPERKGTAHEVACILAELFGDDCACDYCGIDEWLLEKCDFGTLCPDKDLRGVTCWEQYLKHRGDR